MSTARIQALGLAQLIHTGRGVGFSCGWAR
jgi:hypothetical protein